MASKNKGGASKKKDAPQKTDESSVEKPVEAPKAETEKKDNDTPKAMAMNKRTTLNGHRKFASFKGIKREKK